MLVRASHSGGSFLVDVHTTHFTDGQHGGLLNSEWRRETVHGHNYNIVIVDCNFSIFLLIITGYGALNSLHKVFEHMNILAMSTDFYPVP